MNVTMNVECTPEEARRLMGLPDLQPLHDAYLDQLKRAMADGVTPEVLERMFRAWMPVGEVGMNAWRQVMDQMTGTAPRA